MGQLIALAGLPGAGKSTLASHLGRELPATVLSVDPMEASLARAGYESSFSRGLAAYLAAEEVARVNLALGGTVVVDAANYVQTARDGWTSLARETGARLVFVDVMCSDLDLHRRRVQARARNLEGMSEVTWNDVVERYADTEAWGDEPRLMVDSAVVNWCDDALERVQRASTPQTDLFA